VDGAAADVPGIANIDKRPRASLQHVCKIFCRRYEASVPINVRLADEISRGVGNKRRLGRIVDERGEFIGKVAPKAAATPITVRRMPFSIWFVVSLLKVRNVPRMTAVCGMTL
jgi:hypothetical protein